MAVPSPSALATATRYVKRGVTRYVWVPTHSSYLTPTLAEESAGTDLTCEVIEVSGFTLTAEFSDSDNFCTDFVGKIQDKRTAEDSSLKIGISKTSADVRALLTVGLAGYIHIYHEGIVTAYKEDIWPVTVAAVSTPNDKDEVANVNVMFAVTRVPALGVTIPAA